MFQAVIFDIGQTLIEYKIPLNWSKLYRPAFEHVASECGYHFTEQQFQHAGNVLTKYNTRINPRDYEVSSTQIFTGILEGMDVPMEEINRIKDCFYSFFRQDASPYPEAEETLQMLSAKGILLGTLSDVAYGMDNVYALQDIASTAGAYSVLINRTDTVKDYGQDRTIRSLSELSELINMPWLFTPL